MNLLKIVVSLSGLGLVVFIYWFFFGKRDSEVVAGDMVKIKVDGGYVPQVIKIKKGQKTKLLITRDDPSSCLEEIIMPDFKVKKYLPLHKTVEVEIAPEKAGEYPFHCGMNMFHGKVVVEQ